MKTLKILKTNWINVLAVFAAVYLFTVSAELVTTEDPIGTAITRAFLGGLFAIVMYGIMFWTLFISLMLILDAILLRTAQSLQMKLLLEWFLVSIPFSYWLIKYEQWIFLVGIIALLISQFIRKSKIERILSVENLAEEELTHTA